MLPEQLIGLERDTAIVLLELNKTLYRILNDDGIFKFVTADFVASRINLSIIDGMVTDAFLG